eukprot:3381121-Alexandrium_andersonii.AAC.1
MRRWATLRPRTRTTPSSRRVTSSTRSRTTRSPRPPAWPRTSSTYESTIRLMAEAWATSGSGKFALRHRGR